MASYNKVILLGNITRDIELKYTQGGTAVCDIGLAVNDRVKRGDEYVDEPTFVDITCFGRTAEVANQYLGKGKPVLIDGRLKLNQWQNDAGEKRSKLKVICERLQMLGSKNDSQQQPQANHDPQGVGPHYDDQDGDIPF